MKPIGIAEQLMYSTVRLEADNGSCGTGYYFNFQFGNQIVPVIITNKHVVNNNPDETITFTLHLTDDGENALGNHSVRLTTHWVFHPTKDLCFTYCASVENQIPLITGRRVFKRAIDESLIWGKEQLLDLSISESVTMIGYPIGLWDRIHNFPIFRYGYTAAHPGYDFNEEGIGLVDMACFPGSSGSPIFIVNEGSFKDKHGNISIGPNRIIFLGTLFAGPVMNAEGRISVKEIPTSNSSIITQTQMMINLGYYIKSYEIMDFKQIIEKDLKSQGK